MWQAPRNGGDCRTVPVPLPAACPAAQVVRNRLSGFLANPRRNQLLPLCKQLLQGNPRNARRLLYIAAAGWLCPHCGGPMIHIERLTVQQIRRRSAGPESLINSRSSYPVSRLQRPSAHALDLCLSGSERARSKATASQLAFHPS